MLTCIYHPLDPMRVVEEEEARKLRDTGCWFDCPAKAKRYREKVESEIKHENGADLSKPKFKHKGK